jgi:hypothetical protein
MTLTWTPPKGRQAAILRSLGTDADAIKTRGWKWRHDRWLIPNDDPLADAIGAQPMPAPTIGSPAGYDLLNMIDDRGGIAPKGGSRNPGDYDDMPNLKGRHRLLIRKGGMRPDQMAASLANTGDLSDGYVSTLWISISQAIRARAQAVEHDKLESALEAVPF